MRYRSALLGTLLSATAIAVPAGGARAAFSAWTETPGGRIRLVIDTAPGAPGELAGAVEVALKPGWKTYWLEPGEAGVPPRLDLSQSSNIAETTMQFPAPHRFNDGFAVWAGYKQPVAFPVTMKLVAPDAPAHVKGQLFLGICEAICIPVQAEFDVDAAPGDIDQRAHTLVMAARAALPAAPTPGFGIAAAHRDADRVIFEAMVPDGAPAPELFIAGGERATFAPPTIDGQTGGKILYSARIVVAPHRFDQEPLPITYTLTDGRNAVSGEITAQ